MEYDEIQFSILIEDLKSLNIGTYLKSRDFKVFLAKCDRAENWWHVLNDVKDKRSHYAIGHDHDYFDSFKTLKIFIESIKKVPQNEDFVSDIIKDFIKKSLFKRDFGKLSEAFELSKFSKLNITKIKEAIDENNLKQIDPSETILSSVPLEKKSMSNEIFIVHGHDELLKTTVSIFLDKLKLRPIVLHEQPNSGKTIIEKFESYSQNIGFVIVLLTDDDLGKSKMDVSLSKRARQNVIFELGYFIGKLGRNRVCALYKHGVELPNDINGLLYLEVIDSNNWKMELFRELKAAGYTIDANNII